MKKKGWHGDRKGHSLAAKKSAKYRKKRVKGKPVVTKEIVRLHPIRDSKTGEFRGYKPV